MGLRHRAALGISEESDAIAVVVSEETGSISVAHAGRMIRRIDSDRLENILVAFFKSCGEEPGSRWFSRMLANGVRRKGQPVLSSLGKNLRSLAWALILGLSVWIAAVTAADPDEVRTMPTPVPLEVVGQDPSLVTTGGPTKGGAAHGSCPAIRVGSIDCQSR